MDIIKEIAEGCLLSSLTRFQKVIQSPRSHKRVVLKNKDKERVIYVPSRIVKMAQRYVLDHYLCELTPHKCCFSYLKGKSTVLMAEQHLNNNYFLHLDIKHYFDSMDWDVFKNIVLTKYPDTKMSLILNEKDPIIIKMILTFRNRFRQGSVTSPYISDLYLVEFDELIESYVSKNVPNGKYTRYSDDIVISSTTRIGSEIIDYIRLALKKYKLRLNYSKIEFFNVLDKATIVGISITKDNRLTIPTTIKKIIKRLIYYALEKKEKCNYNVLYGYIYYLLMCDPLYFNYLQNKYERDGVLMLDRVKDLEKNANNS